MKHDLRVKVSLYGLLLWAIFLITQTAQAQDRRVTGRVLASKDKQPIPGVNILVRDTLR